MTSSRAPIIGDPLSTFQLSERVYGAPLNSTARLSIGRLNALTSPTDRQYITPLLAIKDNEVYLVGLDISAKGNNIAERLSKLAGIGPETRYQFDEQQTIAISKALGRETAARFK